MGVLKEAFAEIPMRDEPVAHNARFAGAFETAKRAADPAYAAEASRLGLARLGRALATIAMALVAERTQTQSKRTISGSTWRGTAGDPLYVFRSGQRYRWHHTTVFVHGDVAVGTTDARGRWTDPWGVRIP